MEKLLHLNNEVFNSKIEAYKKNVMLLFNLKYYFSIQLSPRRLGVLFFLDKKQNQKNQDWLMQPCNGTKRSSEDVIAKAIKRRNAIAMGSHPSLSCSFLCRLSSPLFEISQSSQNPVKAMLLLFLLTYEFKLLK